MKNDLIKYYLARGKIHQAVRITCLIDDHSLIEKMRYMCNHPLPSHNKENEANSFTNIAQLHETTQKKDKFLIYSMNCREINDKPSYVFKTSKHNLDITLSMDPDRKTVCGCRSLLSYEKAYFDGMHRHCRRYKTLTLWTHHLGMC